MKKMIIFIFVLSVVLVENIYANAFINDFSKLEDDLKKYNLISAREYLFYMEQNGLTKEEWIKVRDLIHQYPQIGLDVLLSFDKNSPYPLNKVDAAIKKADQLMSNKKFLEAAYGYQEILKFITKSPKFKNGRNLQLYWSLIHSLARAFYGLKQYDDAYTLYATIPSSYPFYRQVQFERMWNNYMNDKLDYALGAIPTMASGRFSKILEAEVYLVQYYIYKRLCRFKEAEAVKRKVKAYQKSLDVIQFQLGNWIKKDVVNLIYRQVLLSGDLQSEETNRLKNILELEKNKDFERMKKEFDLVVAHLDLDSGNNNNLKPVKTPLIAKEIFLKSYEKWNSENGEFWPDEMGKYVFVQKDVCKKIKTLIGLFLISTNCIAALSFDTTALKKEVKTLKSEDQITKSLKVKSSSTYFNLDQSIINQDENKIIETLKRFDLILQKEKKEENVFSIDLNRAVCYLQLARINRIKSIGKELPKDSPKEDEVYLKKSLSILDKLLKKESLGNEARGQLKYLRGVTLLDLGMKEISRSMFEEAIEIYPEAKYVPSLNLYLSDLLYAENFLDKALVSYKKFYDRMSQQEKDLADYKIGWINLNQSKIDEATEYFIKLVENSKSVNIVQDSMFSLAVTFSDKLTEEAVLKKVEGIKTTEDRKINLFQSVYDSFIKSPQKSRRKIWERILSTVTGEEEITKLLSSEFDLLEFDQKSEKDLNELIFINQYMKSKLENIKKFNPIFLTALGQSLEQVIGKSLIQYQKDKSINNYQAVSLSIESYLLIDSFARQVEVASLYIDLLVDRNEDEKLVNYCKEILKKPQFASLKDKALTTILVNLEQKYLANPKDYQAKFFPIVRIYLKDPRGAQWKTVATKFYDYLIKAGLLSEAEELINNINSKFPSSENFFKIITVKFEQKKCAEVLELLQKNSDNNPQLLDYKRECFLTLARESKKDLKGFDSYQKNILEFIAMTDEPKKTTALIDYLNALKQVAYDKTSDPKYMTEFSNLIENTHFKQRFQTDFFPIYQSLIEEFIENGNFTQALKYLEECEHNVTCKGFDPIEKKIRQLILIDEANKADKLVDFTLSGDVLSYSTLLSPEIVFLKVIKDELKLENNLTLLTSRLAQIDWSDEQYKNIYQKLETILSRDEKLINSVATWKLLGKIKFPEGGGRHKLKDKEILNLMKQVQKTRESILTDLSTTSLLNQKELLSKARDVEQRMAEVINLSPIPKNLEVSKRPEYEANLKQLSEEFTKQASTYQKTIDSLTIQIDQNNSVLGNNEKLLSPKSLDDWNFGSIPEKNSAIKSFLKNDNFFQAFFYIDYLNGLKKLTKEDYYYMRSGLLLFSGNKRNKPKPMIKYVKNECESNKQNNILTFWEGWSKK
jgi:hypothetical protein